MAPQSTTLEIVIGRTVDTTVLFGNGAGTENVDIEASAERFDELLVERVQAAYPEATVTLGDKRGIYDLGAGDGANPFDTDRTAAVQDEISAIVDDLFNRSDEWIVEREPVTLREYGVYTRPAVYRNGHCAHAEDYVIANASDEGGYTLYTAPEWHATSGPDWSADAEGALEFQGSTFEAGGLTIADLVDTGWTATDQDVAGPLASGIYLDPNGGAVLVSPGSSELYAVWLEIAR